MASISNRLPSVTIEYDCRGHRACKTFSNAYQARSFYKQKLQSNKHPKVIKGDSK